MLSQSNGILDYYLNHFDEHGTKDSISTLPKFFTHYHPAQTAPQQPQTVTMFYDWLPHGCQASCLQHTEIA